MKQSSWRFLWKSEDIRNKLLMSLLLLAVYRLAANIPVPGIDRAAVAGLSQMTGAGRNLVNLLDLLSGGAVSQFSILAMGVYPYITAQIILQLLTPVIPALERKMKDDPRVTKIGKFIRETSIDELPQLLNIIRGDMSIVGPRPALPREVEQYGEYERLRLQVKPGLTCYWQASGRNEIGFHEWMAMDRKYVHEHSLRVDARLVLITIRMVLTRKGAM